MERNIDLLGAVAHVFITDELLRRDPAQPDYLREKLAIQDLAQCMADHPAEVLPRLVQLALEICDADSAGISVLDGDVFRWFNLKGSFAVFEGATTPRDFSPCGVCLDHGSVVLMERPERVYQWIADTKIAVPEVLLVPLLVNGKTPLGTLWVVAKEGEHFDSGHSRVMMELAVFTGIALRMIQSDQQLKKALDEQATVAKEMSRRLKNVFAVTDGMIRMTARNSTTKEGMTESLMGRLRAFSDAHSLVRRSFNPDNETKGVELSELIATVLRPYRNPALDGPAVKLGEHATNNIALIFHEFATNAAKYGALTVDSGAVHVGWRVEGDQLVLSWKETGGPAIAKPEKKGFGSSLVATTITGHEGTIAYDWEREGLGVRIALPMAGLTR